MSTAIRNLKPERWGSPLVQEENYQRENACDKSNEMITIIIIIEIVGSIASRKQTNIIEYDCFLQSLMHGFYSHSILIMCEVLSSLHFKSVSGNPRAGSGLGETLCFAHPPSLRPLEKTDRLNICMLNRKD